MASEVGAVLWDQALTLWDLTLSPGTVRIKLNCRYPASVRELEVWEKSTHFVSEVL